MKKKLKMKRERKEKYDEDDEDKVINYDDALPFLTVFPTSVARPSSTTTESQGKE